MWTDDHAVLPEQQLRRSSNQPLGLLRNAGIEYLVLAHAHLFQKLPRLSVLTNDQVVTIKLPEQLEIKPNRNCATFWGWGRSLIGYQPTVQVCLQNSKLYKKIVHRSAARPFLRDLHVDRKVILQCDLTSGGRNIYTIYVS